MSEERKPYTIWAGTTTFRKNGTPVLGTLGVRANRVVVMSRETFLRLVKENRDMDTAQFNLCDMDE